MSTMHLSSLAQALAQPFPPEQIRFRPTSPVRQANGQWACLACPYATRAIYEDRLNELAFGEWSTPYHPPYTVGEMLLVPVTVIICQVEHTAYGDVSLTDLLRQSSLRTEKKSAIEEATAEGFRRACSHFLLGRYFSQLPRITVPYDPRNSIIALDTTRQHELAIRLYREAGLPLASIIPPAAPHIIASTPKKEAIPHDLEPRQAVKELQRSWFEQELNHDAERIRRVCQQYKVANLDQLSHTQCVHLTRRIFALKAKQKQAIQSA